VREILSGKLFWSLDRGGVMRMCYSKGNLEMGYPDETWDMPSNSFEGSYRQHWVTISGKYIPRMREVMTQLGF